MHNNDNTVSLPNICNAILLELRSSVPGLDVHYPELSSATTTAINDNPIAKLESLCKKGVPLCQLFNALCPQSPIDYTQRDGSTKNPQACVGHFIVACHGRLGMDHKDLFTVNDLFHKEEQGFPKVIQTLQHLLKKLNQANEQQHAKPMDSSNTRERVLTELIDTERRYVQDLDALEYYRMEAQSQHVLPIPLLRRIFANLDNLLKFQRRLLAYAEDIINTCPPAEQRFGKLFIDMEEGFSVYEPYCANIQRAQDTILQETGKLQKLAYIMNPHFELPSMLIKPVQRVCKYPLLLQELIKATPEEWATYDELKQGLEAIQRVTTKINETKRGQENATVVQNIINRVKDKWKREIPSFGLLLLHENFDLERHGVENHVQLYLFEKALLICEHVPLRKSSSISVKKKKSKDINTQALTVRGRIPVSQMVQVADTSLLGQYMLKMFWSERDHKTSNYTITSCTIKCRNKEQLKQWNEAFTKRIQFEKARARTGSTTKISTMVPRPAAPALPVEDNTTTQWGPPPSPSIHSRGYNNNNNEQQHHDDDNDTTRLVDEEDDAGYPKSRLAEKAMQNVTSTPGMVLPPLPGKEDYFSFASSSPQPPLFYPSSPLSPSYPPTPSTISTRASVCSSIGGVSFSSWSIPRKPSDSSGPPFTDNSIAEAGMDEEELPEEDEEDDFGNAVGAPLMTRTRSKSSPNISQSWYQDALHPLDVVSQQAAFLSSSSTSSASSFELVDNIKIRLYYKNELYLVIAPMNIRYKELLQRAEAKMRQCSVGHSEKSFQGRPMTLKYRDEDGDMITIGSDDDIQMAFECRQETNAINLYIY